MCSTVHSLSFPQTAGWKRETDSARIETSVIEEGKRWPKNSRWLSSARRYFPTIHDLANLDFHLDRMSSAVLLLTIADRCQKPSSSSFWVFCLVECPAQESSITVSWSQKSFPVPPVVLIVIGGIPSRIGGLCAPFYMMKRQSP